MNKKRRKILKFLVIFVIVVLSIIAIIEAFVLISYNKKIEDLENKYEIVQKQLEE